MISEEILKKVKKIEIISRKTSKDTFQGEYHSAFKGRGIEFSEVREYIPGDDVRFVDWNVTSRMGRLYVKQFIEERELTVFLVIDLSASLNFFSKRKSKKELAAEISAIIAFTAMRNNDKVGLLIFTDKVELFIPPRKGKINLLRIIREILTFDPQGKGTSIEQGLAYLNRVVKKKAIVFLLSDFISQDYTKSIKVTSKKHDLIAVKISDQKERKLPKAGVFILKDPETSEEFYADFSSREFRENFEDLMFDREQIIDKLFKKYKIDQINIRDEDDYEHELFNFFLKRKKKYRQ